VTVDLLNEFGLNHDVISRQPKNKLGLLKESLIRLVKIWSRLVRYRHSAVFSRNPIGLLAARLSGTPAIFDTDNGSSAGIHFRLSMLFATCITCPSQLELHGHRIRAYAALKPDSYLADSKTYRTELVDSGRLLDYRPILFVRLVSFGASHDVGHTGISEELVSLIAEKYSHKFRIIVSTEFDGSKLQDLGLELDQGLRSEFHKRLAHASIVLTDSGTVSQEAYLLGIPVIFIGSLAGNCEIQNALARGEETFKVISISDDYEMIMTLVDTLCQAPFTPPRNIGSEDEIAKVYESIVSRLRVEK